MLVGILVSQLVVLGVSNILKWIFWVLFTEKGCVISLSRGKALLKAVLALVHFVVIVRVYIGVYT